MTAGEASATPERRVFSVREFAAALDRLFASRSGLADIAIRGEISGLREFGNGHASFTLKDQEAVVDCIVWSDRRRNLPQQLANGSAAIARGAVRVRAERSGYQLLVESVELAGIGELFAMYEKLKEKFRAEGLFEIGRKRAVPELPRRVALISARGKAMQDFVETIQRNVPFVEVTFIEARVQGSGAEIEIAAALDAASKTNPDAIVLTRGGGSYEDLFPFNLEPVVRAIVRARAPVLTAIGHSGDHHLADDVADMTFGTPSLAAEHIAKGWLFARNRLGTAQRDLRRAMRDVLLRGEQRVASLKRDFERAALLAVAGKRAKLAEGAERLERRNPARIVAEARTRVARSSGRLDAAIGRVHSRKARAWGEAGAAFERAIVAFSSGAARRLERARAQLERVDPLSPLERGYAIVTAGGRALKDAAGVAPGEEIEARLYRGTIGARVESVRDHE